MLVEISKWILIIFGVFFIFVGVIMLFKPKTAGATLRKAGSTNFINYTEITLRMIPAAALIIFSNASKYPDLFRLIGWFMLLTSLVLYFVPRRLHHNFSNKCADILKPQYFLLIAPFAVIIGIIIILSVK